MLSRLELALIHFSFSSSSFSRRFISKVSLLYVNVQYSVTAVLKCGNTFE